MKPFVVLAVLLAAVPASAQAVGPCAHVYFEFEADMPARFIADSSLALRPGPQLRNPPNLVQVVVDSAGVPLSNTFKLLKVSDGLTASEAHQAVERWRYVPATVAGAKVCQLVQTPVAR